MQTPTSHFSALPVNAPLLRILLIYLTLALSSIALSYLSGRYAFQLFFPWVIISWIYAATLAVFLEYSRKLSVPQRKSFPFRVLFMIPALVQVIQDMENTFRLEFFHNTQLFGFLAWVGECGAAIVGARLLHSAYKFRATQLDDLQPVSDNSTAVNDLGSHDAVLTNLLGRGNGYVDRVIHSVINRSLKSERMATFSLVVMLVLVLIGGMASFGLWAFTHADRISSIETERNKLTGLQAEMQGLKQGLASNKPEAAAKLDQLLTFVEQNYKTSPSYEATLNRLSQQSQSNYADIAIRVTIAVLTIFLVQVFFAVYKYNRHLAIMLSAKAEALELLGTDEDARKELSREAVSIVKEAVPAFGAQPRTPIEEVARLAEKIGKR